MFLCLESVALYELPHVVPLLAVDRHQRAVEPEGVMNSVAFYERYMLLDLDWPHYHTRNGLAYVLEIYDSVAVSLKLDLFYVRPEVASF